MNFSKSLLILALSGMLFVSCKNEPKATETGEPTETAKDTTTAKPTAENLQTASFQIDGMSCAVGCAKTIEKKLASLDGVQDAKVDFEKKTATVAYDASKQTPETLVETVEAVAGGTTYKVSNVKSSADKAMLYKEKEKEKKKKDDKKASCHDDKSKDAKGGCCSGKKACSSDDKKAKNA
ncbi:mercuric ion binding protein [Flavobacterium sp. 28YEA47A]|uniref:heavy-metal-associated domain-containing protein n=1 Tax=Flavobacterium sp. 28YEA47A TaxID=3156276 RepID=UPI003513B8D6